VGATKKIFVGGLHYETKDGKLAIVCDCALVPGRITDTVLWLQQTSRSISNHSEEWLLQRSCSTARLTNREALDSLCSKMKAV
jgi:hypothetical protein